MITRYQVSFEDRMIEPYDHGKWVKYDDIATLEASVEGKAREMAQAIQGREREELHSMRAQVAELTETKNLFSAELQARDAQIYRQHELLRLAKHRLELHGHAPNCGSRYRSVSADGQENIHWCDCGLNDWFKESGVHG